MRFFDNINSLPKYLHNPSLCFFLSDVDAVRIQFTVICNFWAALARLFHVPHTTRGVDLRPRSACCYHCYFRYSFWLLLSLTLIDNYSTFLNCPVDIVDARSILMHSIRYNCHNKYSDVIISAVASQLTSVSIVYSTVFSGADQRKHQSSESLAFVRSPVDSPHKGPVTPFPFDDAIMIQHHIDSNRTTYVYIHI